jgi:hypothetical protein
MLVKAGTQIENKRASLRSVGLIRSLGNVLSLGHSAALGAEATRGLTSDQSNSAILEYLSSTVFP